MPSFIRRIVRQAFKSYMSFYGSRDARRLSKLFPAFEKYDHFSETNMQILKPAYDQYVADVSSKDMATSWEISNFLYTIAEINKPKRILDLGSGFSSYVLRTYAMNAQNDVLVYSVDDNDQWLQKTKTFLIDNGIDSKHLLHWIEFEEYNKLKFDFIFDDLGSMEMRAEALPFVLSLLDDSGMIVLDDMHKWSYRNVAVKLVKQVKLSLYSTHKFTLDKFGRFAEIAL